MKIIEINTVPIDTLPYLSSGRNEVRSNTLPFLVAYADTMPKGIDVIVATSDLQGRELNRQTNRLLGEEVADKIIEHQRAGLISKVGMVLLSGDLFDSPTLHKMGASGDVKPVYEKFGELFDTVVAVHGNHDVVTDEINCVDVVDGTSVTFSNVTISGVCGITGKPTKNQRKSPEDFEKYLKKALRHRPDILLLHQSPKGDGEQKGNVETRELLEKGGNCLVVSGHCHWSDPLCDIGGNQILNVDSRVVYITRKPS